jgi:hypothetical protein
VTTATHAALLSVVTKTGKLKNGLKEIGKERLKTSTVQRRLDNVDDVFHYNRFIYPEPDFPDQSQDLAPFLPDGVRRRVASAS